MNLQSRIYADTNNKYYKYSKAFMKPIDKIPFWTYDY